MPVYNKLTLDLRIHTGWKWKDGKKILYDKSNQNKEECLYLLSGK